MQRIKISTISVSNKVETGDALKETMERVEEERRFQMDVSCSPTFVRITYI